MHTLFKDMQLEGDVLGGQGRCEDKAVLDGDAVVLIGMKKEGGRGMCAHMELAAEHPTGVGLLHIPGQAGKAAVVIHPGGGDDGVAQDQGVGTVFLPRDAGALLDIGVVPVHAKGSGKVAAGREAADGDLIFDHAPLPRVGADNGHGLGQLGQGPGERGLFAQRVIQQEYVETGRQVGQGDGVALSGGTNTVAAAGADQHSRPFAPDGHLVFGFVQVGGQGDPSVAG